MMSAFYQAVGRTTVKLALIVTTLYVAGKVLEDKKEDTAE